MKIAFIAAVDYIPFGGSEVLWYRTALQLAKEFSVGVNVRKWDERPAHIQQLILAGCQVEERATAPTFSDRIFNKFSSGYFHRRTYEDWLKRYRPELAVISLGSNLEGLEWMRACAAFDIPYCIIVQVASDHLWPDDTIAEQFAEAYANAQAVFFVSRANRQIVEKQFGIVLNNAKVVRNPFNVSYENYIPFPEMDSGVRLAAVGRLDPFHKGHDIIIEVLKQPKWKERPLTVDFYGAGPKIKTLQKFAGHSDVSSIRFKGHVDNVASIWEHNHALLLPSRLEGLPLSLVECMLCGRPGIVTNVGGNSEIIEDNKTGFLAPSPTPYDVDGALERAWAIRDQWEAMGKLACQKIKEHIPEDPVNEFTMLLKEIIR